MVSFPQRSYPMGGESGSSTFNKERALIGTIFEHCESPVDSSIPRSSPSPCNLPLKEEPQREAITVTERFLDDGFQWCFFYRISIFSGYWTTSEYQNQPLYFYPKY